MRSRMITAPAFITQNKIVYNPSKYEQTDGHSMSNASLCQPAIISQSGFNKYSERYI